ARDIDADLIVTIGGGSVTDAGKAVPFCLANNIRTAEDLDALRPVRGPDGALEAPAGCQPPVIRQIAVPTTLSAGEFSALSGLTDKRSRIKEIFWHPELIPAAVVLDPAVTMFTPEDLFLSTGIRAIDHCVEGICSTQANPYTDAQALHGLALLANGLRRVKSRPDDLDARLDCQFGAWLSMAPVTSGVPMGASHGIGYVLGAAFDIPHGHTSCIMLPAVMRWNLPATRSQQTAIAAALGGRTAEEGSALVSRLIADLGMPTRLSGLDIGRNHFRDIAEHAMATAWVPRNPRPINGPEQVLEILELAA
ncbi:MAG: iron-containing alcohol dehydrogenase, partial [Burkholderiaceae bacterium]